MQRIKPIVPAAALAGSLASLGFIGVVVEPGSIVLLALGCALMAARNNSNHLVGRAR